MRFAVSPFVQLGRLLSWIKSGKQCLFRSRSLVADQLQQLARPHALYKRQFVYMYIYKKKPAAVCCSRWRRV